MHWRTQFPPKNASVLAELIAVFRTSFHPKMVMATERPDDLPDELPPALEPDVLPAGPAPAAN
jgi:hypothetical protein